MTDNQPPQPPQYDKIGYLVHAAAWQNTQLEQIMATQAELQSQLDAQNAALAAHDAAVKRQIQQVADSASQILALVEELRAGAVTQAQIDDLAQNTQSLVDMTAAMGADDAPNPQPLPPANP